MFSERKAILERYAWDRTQNEEELLIRAMMYHNPVELLRAFSREELKKTFFENLHRFDDKNLNFWKFALEVSDEEFNRYAEGNFGFGLRKFVFFEYGYPLVKPTIREEGLGIDIASDEDISAMKLLAIAKRGVKKDFYDLWFLMKKRGWDLRDVIGFAKFKYPNIDTGIYLRSIVYFKDAEKETAQKEVEMAWEQIKEFFEFQCKSLLKDINLL